MFLVMATIIIFTDDLEEGLDEEGDLEGLDDDLVDEEEHETSYCFCPRSTVLQGMSGTGFF
ncbi:hypothetical protein KBB05_01545 [Patescibacteria group bacterium]|nr:hypothetical protein [Patescibacteria group bacterium]